MKFKVTFKTPDAVDDAITEEAIRIMDTKRSIIEDALGYELTHEEMEAMTEARKYTMHDCADKFVKHGEYITIEFDPKEGTARVVPAGN